MLPFRLVSLGFQDFYPLRKDADDPANVILDQRSKGIIGSRADDFVRSVPIAGFCSEPPEELLAFFPGNSTFLMPSFAALTIEVKTLAKFKNLLRLHEAKEAKVHSHETLPRINGAVWTLLATGFAIDSLRIQTAIGKLLN